MRRHPYLMRLSMLFLLSVTATLAAGCNVIGFAAATVAGTSNTPPMYILPKQRTVVVAENYLDPARSVRDDEALARYLTDLLKQADLAPMIDPGEVYVMRHDSAAGEKSWRGLSIAAVGRSVTAQQVIYVNIISAEVESAGGSEMLRGHGEVLVRVVDAETGATLWPTDAADGYPVNSDTRMYHEGETEVDIRTTLQKDLAEKIKRLFTGYRTD
jgi:hypothetical protein